MTRGDATFQRVFSCQKIILKKFLQTLDSIKKDTVSLSIERTKHTNHINIHDHEKGNQN